MSSKRDRIFDAIEAALDLMVPAPAQIEFMPNADPGAFPALHVHDFGQDLERGEAGTVRYRLSITIEGYVQSGSGRAALRELNELHAGLLRAMFAEYNDGPLNGLADEIEEGAMTTAVAGLAADRRLGFSQDFTISYATTRGEPDD